METPQLLEALEEIRDEARLTQQKFDEGKVVNGRSAIYRMELMAKDALLDHQESSAPS